MLYERFKVLIYKICQSFKTSCMRKSKILKRRTFWLFWGLFVALFERESAMDFQKLFSIWPLFAVECLHSVKKRNL